MAALKPASVTWKTRSGRCGRAGWPPTSASLGTIGRRGHQRARAPGRRQVQTGRPGGQMQARAPVAERVLHQPVLARMIADHRQAAARHQRVAEGTAAPAPARRARRSPRSGTAWKIRANSPGPARGPSTARMALTRSSLDRERAALPPPDDLARQRAGPALVAVVARRSRASSASGNSLSRSAAVAPAAPMRMSSATPGRKVNPRASVVELAGRDAEVEQDEVGPERRHGLERGSARRTGPRGTCIRASPSRARAVASASGSRSMPRTSAPCARSAPAWPPSPSGGVHHPARPGRRRQDLGEQDGLVQRLGVAGGHGMAGKEKRTPSEETECGTERTTGLTGLEPATSAVTVRHSNQAELQPPDLCSGGQS